MDTDERYGEQLRAEWERLGQIMRGHAEGVQNLPGEEGEIVRLATTGMDWHQVAQAVGTSERRVWNVMREVVDVAEGHPAGGAAHGYETGGLGADTDPGVTGGYGDTGFGSLDSEPTTPGEQREAGA